LTEFNTKLI